MLHLLAAHLVMALVAPALVAWLGRRAFLVMALAPASAAVWALAHTSAVLDGRGPVEVVSWVPGLSLELAFRLDTLSWLMVLLVGGVGALVLVYSSAYFSSSAGGLGRFGGVLVAFAGAMLGLVAADDLLLLYVFWELTTVFSYLLIGHYADRKASRRAAMQAIILTTAGGLAMLVGFVLIGHAAGTYRLSAVVADPPTGTIVSVAIACVLAGAITKSALIPFHFWLPAAMAAPTPVSAYLHAAAMVKAGVYLVARFAPGYADLTVWRTVVLTLGCGTLLLGGYRAMRQHDLKLVLAFGTVSQLGLIVLLVGYGTRATALAGLALVGAHAMFKAALFLVVGVVDAAAGTRDLRRLSGVGRALPITAAAGVLATASMIGLPPFAGYVAKEAALEALLHDEDAGAVAIVVLVAVAVGSAFTVAYGLRFLWGAFARKPHPPAVVGADDDVPAEFAPVSRQSLVMVAPAALLAVLGLAVAVVPSVGERLLAPYAATLPRGEEGHLVLWGGLTPALGITVAVVVAGVLLFAGRTAVERVQAALHTGPEADRAYRRTMRKLDDVAADVTAMTQRGSLPFYLSAILAVMVLLSGTALVTGTRLPTDVVWGDSVLQAMAAVLVIVAAVLAANARRRLKSVILLGACGYGIAVLFLLHGAPDLALTQVLVETITLVVFVLVLRRLPPYFSDRPLARSRWLRLALAVAVGTTVGALALVAPGARLHLPQSVPFPEEAYAFGGGKNIVNVVLVDIRAWDTMGEIAVLLVAATGVASLIFLQRRSGGLHRIGEVDEGDDAQVWGGGADPGATLRRPRMPEQASTSDAPLPSSRAGAASVGMASRRARAWLRAEQTLAPQRRSVIFEVVTRLLFHTMVIVALYLLFAGHNSPGGGFAAGLVVGVALIVRYLAGGRYELGEAAPVHPGLLLGSGLFLSAGVGLVALLAGGEVLQSTIVDLEVPVLGTIHLVTSLFFDIGVFLVVIGLVLDVLRSLGAEIDRHGEQDGGDAAGSEHGVGHALPSAPTVPAEPPAEPSAPTGTRDQARDTEGVS